MTDKEFLYDYLDKYYTVKLNSSDYAFYDLISKKSYTTKSFFDIFETIFTDFEIEGGKTSLNICYEWFAEKRDVLVSDLMAIIKTLDLSQGSTACISNLKYRHKLEEETKYSFFFVETTFNDYYKNHALNQVLVDYAARLDDPSVDIERIYAELMNELTKETDKLYDYSLDFIGSEVFDKHIDEKLDDLFSQLVITLGRFNWNVTWIGHGKLTEEKLLSNFARFGERYSHRIINRYDMWYSQAIVEASERCLARSKNNDTPTFVPLDHELAHVELPENDTRPVNYNDGINLTDGPINDRIIDEF